jgi:hypothetical protein
MRPYLFVVLVGVVAAVPAAAQLPDNPPVVQPDVKMPAPPQIDPPPFNPPPFPVTPTWQPPPNWGGVQPLGNPVQAAADQAEQTVWTWVISSMVGTLAILAGVAARFVVRARANGDFSDDPWIKAQMENGGKQPG